MLQKLRVIVLALTLSTAINAPVFAEGMNGNQNGNNTNTYQDNNNYRTTAVDTDSDWEWIGLLGLAGLAGLRGRDRHREPERK